MAVERGYVGRILDVDLTRGTWRAIPLGAELALRFLGGRGLAAHLLFEHLPPGADPLGPENLLIFASGPLNGTLVPGSNRIVVTAKSPLTECYAASVAGRDFAAILKYAGCDALILRGQTPEPCYLLVADGEVSLRPSDRHVDLNVLIAETRAGRLDLVKYIGRVEAPSQCPA